MKKIEKIFILSGFFLLSACMISSVSIPETYKSFEELAKRYFCNCLEYAPLPISFERQLDEKTYDVKYYWGNDKFLIEIHQFNRDKSDLIKINDRYLSLDSVPQIPVSVSPMDMDCFTFSFNGHDHLAFISSGLGSPGKGANIAYFLVYNITEDIFYFFSSVHGNIYYLNDYDKNGKLDYLNVDYSYEYKPIGNREIVQAYSVNLLEFDSIDREARIKTEFKPLSIMQDELNTLHVIQ